MIAVETIAIEAITVEMIAVEAISVEAITSSVDPGGGNLRPRDIPCVARVGHQFY